MTKKQTFKVGDELVGEPGYESHHLEDGRYVKITEILDAESGNYAFDVYDSGGSRIDTCTTLRFGDCLDVSRCRLRNTPRTLSDLRAGDEVLTHDGDTRVILARLEDCVLLSYSSICGKDFRTMASGWYHVEEMKHRGFTLPAEPEEKQVVEKSVAELESELKLPSGSLRIKKDADA